MACVFWAAMCKPLLLWLSCMHLSTQFEPNQTKLSQILEPASPIERSMAAQQQRCAWCAPGLGQFHALSDCSAWRHSHTCAPLPGCVALPLHLLNSKHTAAGHISGLSAH